MYLSLFQLSLTLSLSLERLAFSKVNAPKIQLMHLQIQQPLGPPGAPFFTKSFVLFLPFFCSGRRPGSFCSAVFVCQQTSIPDLESNLDQNCLSRCSTEIFSEASWEQVDKQDTEVQAQPLFLVPSCNSLAVLGPPVPSQAPGQGMTL